MAGRCPGAPPPPPPPGKPAAVGLVADRSPPLSAAALRTDCPPRYPSQSCPCAIGRRAAGHARPHCSSARRPPRGQTSRAPPTTYSTPGTAPLPSGSGSPAHAEAAAPAGPGGGSVAGATPRVALPHAEAVPEDRQALDFG